MTRPTVLLTDRAWPDAEIERRLLANAGFDLVEAPDDREQTLVRLVHDCQGLLACWARVSETVISAGSQLRGIGRLGIGLDNIDLVAATRRRIPVTNVPDYCIEEVADHAMALLLAVWRNIAWFHLQSKQGVYDLKAAPPLSRLRGKTLGLIGLGRIGRAMAERASAFGLRLQAVTASGSDHGLGIPIVDLETLLATSDAISLHAPLTPATHHLLNRDRLSRCRPGMVVVNTARGGLIDRSALWEAIQGGHVAGAGLDVFEVEPPNLTEPLYQDPRVVVSPHAAFVSSESLVELRERATMQMVDVLCGKRPANVVNPVVYSETHRS